MSEETQLEAVSDYWSNLPNSKLTIDPENPQSWGTIWEMVRDGQWCQNSIAVGMEATLRLAGWSSDRLQIRHIIDQNISEQVMVVRVDARIALNYEFGRVVDYPKTRHRVLRQWQHNGRSYYDTFGR